MSDAPKKPMHTYLDVAIAVMAALGFIAQQKKHMPILEPAGERLQQLLAETLIHCDLTDDLAWEQSKEHYLEEVSAYIDECRSQAQMFKQLLEAMAKQKP